LILSFPALFVQLRSVVLSHREIVSSMTLGIIRNCAPLHRLDGTYTVGSEFKFSVIQILLNNLLDEVNDYDYQVGLASNLDMATVKHFHSDLSRHLRYLTSSSDQSEFILRALSILKESNRLFSGKDSSWDTVSGFFATGAPESASLGLRKLFRICDAYIGSGSDLPEVEKVYLFDLICDQTYVEFGGIVRVVNAPTTGCTLMQLVGGSNQEMLRRVVLHLQNDAVVPFASQGAGIPKGKTRNNRRNKHVPGLIPSDVPAGAKPMHTRATPDLGDFALDVGGKWVYFPTLEALLKYNESKSQEKL
jgi:hypothetical protein